MADFGLSRTGEAAVTDVGTVYYTTCSPALAGINSGQQCHCCEIIDDNGKPQQNTVSICVAPKGLSALPLLNCSLWLEQDWEACRMLEHKYLLVGIICGCSFFKVCPHTLKEELMTAYCPVITTQ